MEECRIFRGKRIDTLEWIEGGYVKLNNRHYIFPCIEISNECALVIKHYEVIPETVSQYTGLNDINHNMIFEDDIVRCKHTVHSTHLEDFKPPRFIYGLETIESSFGTYTFSNKIYWRNYKVQFYRGSYRIKTKNIMHYISPSFIHNHSIEVIGNIHDDYKYANC